MSFTYNTSNTSQYYSTGISWNAYALAYTDNPEPKIECAYCGSQMDGDKCEQCGAPKTPKKKMGATPRGIIRQVESSEIQQEGAVNKVKSALSRWFLRDM